ncbi:MAG: NAD(P)-dependent alcohol dehydrogenase [Paracoccaceae bacterium]
MKVAKVTAYGGVEHIALAQAPMPVAGKGQVLVRVHAAPVTAGDARIRSGRVPRGFGLVLRLVFGWNAPRNPVQGWSFSGEVAGLGEGVGGLSVGQAVFGLAGVGGGAHGEFVAVAADRVMPLPQGMSHEEGAAFFFGGLTASTFLLDHADVKPGLRVLVNGATGSVGSAAVQIAAARGARVTAVCSAANHDLARRLGAAEVVDYRTAAISGQFDVILDVIGTLPWAKAAPHLVPGGRLLLVSASLAQNIGAALWPRRGQGRRIKAVISSEGRANMERLVRQYQAGTYRPTVGQVFALDDIRAAHALAETFSKPGNIILKIAS